MFTYYLTSIIAIFWLPFLIFLFPIGTNPYAYVLVELFFVALLLIIFFVKRIRKKKTIVAFSVLTIMFNTFYFINTYKLGTDVLYKSLSSTYFLIVHNNVTLEDLSDFGVRGVSASKKFSDKIGNCTFGFENKKLKSNEFFIIDGEVFLKQKNNDQEDINILNCTENNIEIEYKSADTLISLSINPNQLNDFPNKLITLENYYTHRLISIEYPNNLSFRIYYIDYEYIKSLCLLNRFVYWFS